MTDKIDDGGPAFPHLNRLEGKLDRSYIAISASGMSLRDWFAGQALAGIMANPERWKDIARRYELKELSYDAASEKNAVKAFSLADAMIAARKTSRPLVAGRGKMSKHENELLGALSATSPPLTDEQFENIADLIPALSPYVLSFPAQTKVNAFIADARWHRAELAKAMETVRALRLVGLSDRCALEDSRAELAKARAENERLRGALVSLEAALLKDSRQKSIVGDDTEYHLDGNSMYHAINKVRAALAPEGKETK